MLVAYLTTDAINQDRAFQLAESCGLLLLPLEPRDGLLEGEFDGIVYDLDHLALLLHPGQILPNLALGNALICTAVHTYNLDGHEADALRRLGIAVYRELQPELFWLLRLAYDLDQAPWGAGPGRATSASATS
jgi:hypothetical protein